MPTRSRFTACAALASLVFAPTLLRAQASRPLTVEYENAPLSRIAASFATFSGRSIVLDTEVGDPAVTASVRDPGWETGLDQILAGQALIARPVAGGGLRIERERKITVDYQNARLGEVVAAIRAFAGQRIELPLSDGDREVSVTIQNVDWQRALDQVLARAGLLARADVDGVLHVVPRSSR